MPDKTIEQILSEHTNIWMDIPGVEGTAIGQSDGKPCILILCSVKPEKIGRQIPTNVEGFPVVLTETGKFYAFDPQ